jgi:hypothetical protein
MTAPVSDTVKVHRVKTLLEAWQHERAKDGPERTKEVLALLDDVIRELAAALSDA